ncbi:MAG: hypothetical protein KGJ01_00935 [Patescibacteria group bacterium]|nr:hypothetical protein [Patescibacteria group bacterium]
MEKLNILKSKVKIALISLPLIITSAINAVPAHAFQEPPTSLPTPPITKVSDVVTLLHTLLNWAYFGFFFLTAVFVLLAAFDYLTAGGDEKKVGAAKTKVIYAVVAIAIALLALGINSIVGNFFGVTTPNPITQ